MAIAWEHTEPMKGSDGNHMKSWITMVFQKRQTSFGFVLQIGDVVERSKQHLLEDVFLMKCTSEKKDKTFHDEFHKGKSQRFNL